MPAGYFQNPYANTGRAAGDFVNAFLQSDRTQGQGYLQGTQAMADIEGKQIANAKAQDELNRMRKFDDMDAIQMLRDSGAPEEVIQQIISGDFTPELAEQLKVASQGAANMRADVAGLNRPFGTQQGASGDIKRGSSVVDVFAANPPQDMNELRTAVAASEGRYPPQGSSTGTYDVSSDAGVTELLGKADIPIYMEARNAGATIEQAIAAVASRKTGIDLNELLKAQPLELIKLIRDPNNAGATVGSSISQFNELYQQQTQPWRNKQTTIGGVNAKWDPVKKVWID